MEKLTAKQTVSDLTEAEAIKQAQAGDAAAFEFLYKAHCRRVYSLCLRMIKNPAEAEDLTQQAFLQLFRKIGTFRGAREVPIDGPNPSPEPVAQRESRYDAPDPEESCSLRERKRIVKSAISGLRPRARNVVELIHLQEHSIRETAQILGISTGTVKSRMFHAKIALHRMPLLQSVGSSNCARQAE
jgi:DNA-directed RNA polymerase specialized sigma24 family protein